MKIQKYSVIFVYILQGKMGKMEKDQEENHATNATKIPKTKRQKYGTNQTYIVKTTKFLFCRICFGTSQLLGLRLCILPNTIEVEICHFTSRVYLSFEIKYFLSGKL